MAQCTTGTGYIVDVIFNDELFGVKSLQPYDGRILGFIRTTSSFVAISERIDALNNELQADLHRLCVSYVCSKNNLDQPDRCV